MEKGTSTSGNYRKNLALAKHYRDIANEAKHSIGIHKAVLNSLQNEYASLKSAGESTEADREKRSELKRRISSANNVLVGLSSKFKNADALARRYEAMCDMQTPEEESIDDILPIEEVPATTEDKESSPIQEVPSLAASVSDCVPAKKSQSRKFSPWFIIIPLLIIALVVAVVMLSKRTSKDEPKASGPSVSAPVQAAVEEPAVEVVEEEPEVVLEEAAAEMKEAAVEVEVTDAEVFEEAEAEEPETAEEVVEETLEVGEENTVEVQSVETEETVIEEPIIEDVEAVTAETEVVGEVAERRIAMLLGYSDAEAEQWYADHGYEVIVLDYVPTTAPVLVRAAAVEEPVVEVVEVEAVEEPEVVLEEAAAETEEAAVEVEVTDAEVFEDAAAEETETEEEEAPTYEHVFSYYIYNAKIVAADGYAYATYPSFVTAEEIYTAASAAVYTYGDAVKDFYISVVEPGRFEVSYPMGFVEADYRFAFEVLDRDLPIYLASLFAPEDEVSPEMEGVVEESVEAITIELHPEPEAQILEVVKEDEPEVSEEPVEEPAVETVEVETVEEPEAVLEEAAVEIEVPAAEVSEDTEVEETEPAEKPETVVVVYRENENSQSKYTFSDLRVNVAMIPYSFQRIRFNSVYVDETSLSGIGFRLGVSKYFRNSIALGFEVSNVSYQYKLRSFNDQRILVKFRSYLPLNDYSDSNLFLTLGAGIDIVTRNDGVVGYYGLANVDFGASFQISKDIYFESGAEFLVGFREDRTTFSTGANFGLSYHIQPTGSSVR